MQTLENGLELAAFPGARPAEVIWVFLYVLSKTKSASTDHHANVTTLLTSALLHGTGLIL